MFLLNWYFGTQIHQETSQNPKDSLKKTYPDLQALQWGRQVKGCFQSKQINTFVKEGSHGGQTIYILWKGDLFNQESLKKTLGISKGSTEAELLIAAWETWGEACFQHFVSEITLVVWLPEKGELFAASDPMGIHTLFYGRSSQKLTLSDDARLVAKALHQHPRLSRQGLLMWCLNAYDGSVSLFDGVMGLKPAHILKIDAGQEKTWVYWNPAQVKDLRYSQTETYVQHLQELMQTCVQDRCRESEVAVMVSGGLDSSSVTALAAENDPGLIALTYQFQELKACDEWPKASLLMNMLQREHIPLDAESNWLLKDRIPMPWQEDPFQSWDQLTQNAMGMLQERGKSILLTGHGGDNLFTGYSKSLLASMPLPNTSWQAWREWLSALAETEFSLPRGAFRYLLRPKYQAMRDAWHPWPSPFPWIRKKACRALFSKGFPWLPRQLEIGAPAKQAMVWMVTDYAMGIRRAIHWYHRMGRRSGITVCHPLFDQRLAEFVVAIPPEKIRSEQGAKGILAMAMKDFLPRSIWKQREKPTLAAYYFQGIAKEKEVLRKFLKGMVLEDLGIVHGEKLRGAFEAYLQGDPNQSLAWFLSTILTEMWLRTALTEGFTL